MEAVIFTGIQASGKSTFFRERFFDTHLLLSLDLIGSRHIEKRILDLYIKYRKSFVVDNTNPTIADRARYIQRAKLAGYKILGYYFETQIASALKRNEAREGKKRIPPVGIRSMRNKLQMPGVGEGFDELYFVRIDESGFAVCREY